MSTNQSEQGSDVSGLAAKRLLPARVSSLDKKTLPSGKMVKLYGVADPDRPWEVHRSGVFASIRRARRGSSGEFENYKGGRTTTLILQTGDAEALVFLLNARVRSKMVFAATKARPRPTAPKQPTSIELPSSAAVEDRPWRADSFGQNWYVCRDGGGILGLTFHTFEGKPQKFDEDGARQVADGLNGAAMRVP